MNKILKKLTKSRLFLARNSRHRNRENISAFRLATQDYAHISESRIAFLHHRTTIFNLGDFLSSPRHYFKFTPNESGPRVAVIGGGVFGRYQRIQKTGEQIDLDNRSRVAWAVGLSLKGADENGVERLADMAKFYTAVTTRDPDHVSEKVKFCPCSSVLNGIVDLAPGKETGILLNFDPRASGENPLEMLRTFPNFVTGVNAVSERDFRRYFARCGRIVTNSYHTAFWGLLSGRSVAIVGFSSKYSSIQSMFELSIPPKLYKMGNIDSLREAIKSTIDKDEFVTLTDADIWRRRFRQLNLDYADELVARGLFKRIEQIPDDDTALDNREAEISSEYVLQEW